MSGPISTTNLSPAPASQSPSIPSSPTSTTPSKSSRKRSTGVRHGRGPLIRDSDDEAPVEIDDENTRLLNGHRETDLEQGGGASGFSTTSSSLRRTSTAGKVRNCCCISFLVVLAVVFLVAAFVHVWLGHLLSNTTLDGKAGLVYSNPTAVRITPFIPPSSSDTFAPATAEGLLVEIDLAAAVDLRQALGWESPDGKDQHREKGIWGWWRKKVELPLLDYFIKEVKEVEVHIEDVKLRRGVHTESWELINFSTSNSNDGLLLSLPQIPPITLPLSHSLKPLTISLPLTFPAASALELAEFVHQIWEEKKWGLVVEVEKVGVRLGRKEGEGREREGKKGLKRWLERLGVTELRGGGIEERIEGELYIRVVSSELPDQDALSSLFELEKYSIYPTNATSSSSFDSSSLKGHPPKPIPATTKIALEALVKLSNPLPLLTHDIDASPSSNAAASFLRDLEFAWHNPWNVPIGVFLPVIPPVLQNQLLRRRDQVTLAPPPTTPLPSPPNPEPKPEEDILIAHLTIPPFAFKKGQKKTEVLVSGELVEAGRGKPTRIAQEKERERYSRTISGFMRNYLKGDNSTVVIKYDAPVIPAELRSNGEEEEPNPPTFLTPLLNSLEAPIIFPGSKEKMELFENLRIEGMKIRVGPGFSDKVGLSSMRGLVAMENEDGDEPEDGDLLCSGKVVGNILLPEHFDKLSESLNVTSILPDVFVYDGHLPALSSNSSYPPSPIPATAFARLRPTTSIEASTIHTPANSTHNATTTISAAFVDAPLYLLEGRSDVFSKFVGKIIFGSALAGARGESGVELGLEGWGEISLDGLSVEGEFMVGGGGF